MATVKFLIKGNNNPSVILVRFTNGRKFDFKRSTTILTDPKHWNNSKGEFRRIATPEERDKKNNQLQSLRTYILESFNRDFSNGMNISSEWLRDVIHKFNSQEVETDLNLFTHYAQTFIENLPNRINHSQDSKIGVAESTIKKYKSVVKKIESFEQYRKSKLYISQIDLKFQREFFDYLKNIDGLSDNTTGRMIKFIKTICRDARAMGVKTHDQLDKIRGFTRKALFIYLDESEIAHIARHDFSTSPYLDNARDWLIIGCCTGQRVSDFMSFSKTSINKKGFLEFDQKKTGAKTVVPIHPLVENIIEKHDGFPRKISEQRFNDYIKEVSKQVGLSEIVDGGKLNPNTKRKEYGKFPKYELVTSHICRRSFATNHYGKLPTPVLMAITNHSTERMFLSYIGKIQENHAETLKKYWEEVQVSNQGELTHMELVKERA